MNHREQFPLELPRQTNQPLPIPPMYRKNPAQLNLLQLQQVRQYEMQLQEHMRDVRSLLQDHQPTTSYTQMMERPFDMQAHQMMGVAVSEGSMPPLGGPTSWSLPQLGPQSPMSSPVQQMNSLVSPTLNPLQATQPHISPPIPQNVVSPVILPSPMMLLNSMPSTGATPAFSPTLSPTAPISSLPAAVIAPIVKEAVPLSRKSPRILPSRRRALSASSTQPVLGKKPTVVTAGLPLHSDVSSEFGFVWGLWIERMTECFAFFSKRSSYCITCGITVCLKQP